MKNRLFSTLLMLCMVLTLFPGTAWAMDSDFVIQNGVLAQYKGSGGDVTIPGGVTSIGYGAFEGCTSLTSVTIPEGVTSIGDYAFALCTSLTNVNIPERVTNIGIQAFYYCNSLTRVTIPNSVTSIGYGAFQATGLTSVTIPNSITSIDDDAFEFCFELTKVTIPDSVTRIGDRAFYWCTNLTSISIPDSVTTIGAGAFKGCRSLTSVTIPNSVTNIGDEAFNDCNNLKDVYYSGSRREWQRIVFIDGNDPLRNATIHCSDGDTSTDPDVPIDYNVPSTVQWSYPVITGGTVTQDTYRDKIQILIFFRANGICVNSNETIRSLASADWIGANDIQVIAVGCGEDGENEQTVKEHVIAYRQKYAPNCEDIEFCYATSTQLWRTVNQLQSLIGGTTNSIMYAVNYFFDYNSRLRFSWQGGYRAACYTNALSLLDIDFEPVITIKPLTKDMFTVDTANEIYDGRAKTKTITGKDAGTALVAGVAYTVTYSNNTNAGTATITITGQKPYSGTLTYNFTINKAERNLTAALEPSQLNVGGSIGQIILMDNATGDSPSYTYTSGKTSVATVIGGMVTPVDAGTTTISVNAPATANYKAGFAMVNVTVTTLPVQDLRFAADSVKKNYGDPAFTNAATNHSAGGGAVTYSSSDPKVATVDAASGKVTIFSDGTTTITATATKVDGIWAETSVSYTLVVGPDTTSNPGESNQPWGNRFADVYEGNWFYDGVTYVAQNGLMQGIGGNKFDPEGTTSRGMIAVILYRLAGEPLVSQSAFTDVAAGQWYTNAVAWSAANKIVEGYGNNTFDPNGNITREQMAVMLWRYMGEPTSETSLSTFADANQASSWAKTAMAWAVENGIIIGTGGKLNPQGNATRAQAATMLMRFCESIVK